MDGRGLPGGRGCAAWRLRCVERLRVRGRAWHAQYRGAANLDQVDFVDADHGWAVGTSDLLATTDGGVVWTTVPEPCPAILSVHCATPSQGYAVAGGSDVRIDGGVPAPVASGQLLITTDGGQSWQPASGAPAMAQTASGRWGVSEPAISGLVSHRPFELRPRRVAQTNSGPGPVRIG
jgi:photosystem II stability/assembly factor-like uncharacterized protein